MPELDKPDFLPVSFAIVKPDAPTVKFPFPFAEKAAVRCQRSPKNPQTRLRGHCQGRKTSGSSTWDQGQGPATVTDDARLTVLKNRVMNILIYRLNSMGSVIVSSLTWSRMASVLYWCILIRLFGFALPFFLHVFYPGYIIHPSKFKCIWLRKKLTMDLMMSWPREC
jgi:hypothetical protein